MMWPESADGIPGRETLLGVRIPYNEEIRPLRIPKSKTKATPPTDEQISAIDEFITALDLMTAHRSVDGVPTEAVVSGSMFNPVRQRQLQCIENRAVEPGYKLPPVDPQIVAHATGGVDNLHAAAAGEIDKLAMAFPLRTVEKKRAGESWNEQAKLASETSTKRIKLEESGGSGGGPELTAAEVLSRKPTAVTEVGEAQPVKDYIALCSSSSNLEMWTEQLQKRINTMVTLHINGADIPTNFGPAIITMRKKCQQAGLYSLFNRHLRLLRDTIFKMFSVGALLPCGPLSLCGASGSAYW